MAIHFVQITRRPMKKLLLLTFFYLSVPIMYGQPLTAQKLLEIFNVPAAKFDDWAAKKRFQFLFNTKNEDTLIKHYSFKSPVKKGKVIDSVQRALFCQEFGKDFQLIYQTISESEFLALINEFKSIGFYCNMEGEPTKHNLYYQHKDFTIKTYKELKDSFIFYTLQMHEQDFPDPQEIVFADDLLHFPSHEYLVHYFGEDNVKKDFYVFSGNELVNCSVLFSNTPRQAVFLWKDEINRKDIDDVLFGSQQKLKSNVGSSKFVAESEWRFKSGVHPGMTLYELRILNGDDLRFYAGNSMKPGAVITGNKGKLDFYKEEIILGCVNCNDTGFGRSETLTADEALADGKILFVFSVALNADARCKTPPAEPVVTK